jgi:hypothetical protein
MARLKHVVSLSVIVTVETNVLLNPSHPDANAAKALRHMPFPWDARLF